MGEQISFEVTDLHAKMLDETRDIAGDGAVTDSIENYIHDLYKQAKRMEAQQVESFEIEEPEERE